MEGRKLSKTPRPKFVPRKLGSKGCSRIPSQNVYVTVIQCFEIFGMLLSRRGLNCDTIEGQQFRKIVPLKYRYINK
jgi:hypothetical protein